MHVHSEGNPTEFSEKKSSILCILSGNSTPAVHALATMKQSAPIVKNIPTVHHFVCHARTGKACTFLPTPVLLLALAGAGKGYEKVEQDRERQNEVGNGLVMSRKGVRYQCRWHLQCLSPWPETTGQVYTDHVPAIQLVQDQAEPSPPLHTAEDCFCVSTPGVDPLPGRGLLDCSFKIGCSSHIGKGRIGLGNEGPIWSLATPQHATPLVENVLHMMTYILWGHQSPQDR